MKKVIALSVACSFLLLFSPQAGAVEGKGLRDLILEKIEQLKPSPGEAAPEKPPAKPKPTKPSEAPQAKPDAKKFSIEVWADKNTYRPGETATISFRVNRASYITIYDIGSSGKATILFPNERAQDNFVKADTLYTVPGEEDRFKYVVGGPPGKDIILAVATLEKIDLTRDVAKEKVGPFKRLIGSFKKIFTRDISVVFEDAPEKVEKPQKVVGQAEPQKVSEPPEAKPAKEPVKQAKQEEAEKPTKEKVKETAQEKPDMQKEKVAFGEWTMAYTEVTILAGQK